ncbi:hypothetical protein EMCG_03962 [[Emmonsia] crescens]|uniref:Uncharacterized protein n=1 Tax=[Emmonsia] crescens TaxID=73230 RepID=A0A0G2J802_9EURO|nr:hypothetical protein EMCG_03962 [Emmonsia crescens UAMH 3008]
MNETKFAWALTGLARRQICSMSKNLSPFAKEIHQRLWWQLVSRSKGRGGSGRNSQLVRRTTYASCAVATWAYFIFRELGMGKGASAGGATAAAVVNHNAIRIVRASVPGVYLAGPLKAITMGCKGM